MTNLVYLIPVALFLGGLALVGFLWALRSGQYEDLDGAGARILLDPPLEPSCMIQRKARGARRVHDAFHGQQTRKEVHRDHQDASCGHRSDPLERRPEALRRPCIGIGAHLSVLVVALAAPPPPGEFSMITPEAWLAQRQSDIEELEGRVAAITAWLAECGVSGDVASNYPELGRADEVIGAGAVSPTSPSWVGDAVALDPARQDDRRSAVLVGASSSRRPQKRGRDVDPEAGHGRLGSPRCDLPRRARGPRPAEGRRRRAPGAGRPERTRDNARRQAGCQCGRLALAARREGHGGPSAEQRPRCRRNAFQTRDRLRRRNNRHGRLRPSSAVSPFDAGKPLGASLIGPLMDR